MLKPLEDYGRYVEISGFRNVAVGDARAFMDGVCRDLPVGVAVQLFDATLVATWEHLYFAALNALMAFKNKCNVSKSLAVEMALYASAKRQIKKALEFIGVKPGSGNIAVVVLGADVASVQAGLSAVGKRLGMEPDADVLGLSEAKIRRIREAFDVSDAELLAVSACGDAKAALVDLVVERIALLSTRL
jgi:tRNA threonylcarbamoyladenosine modification (KEOPS) complex Cgi121 subunit